ncbi:P-loop NTPase fold protein [Citrobacter portucalensis]|nr:P-loop NTPase fold protein [Citrobacter portucalensis]DAL83877.1 MAG TPA: KAP family P-loop domain [Caudoviricetes sp.]
MRMTAPLKSFSDGFCENDDIFERKKLHDIIMRVATNAPDKSLVLALDDKWGNGKTSFVKMMESEISKKHSDDFEVIYFDAFKSDYQSDPFVALTSNIYSLVSNEEGKLKTLGEKLLSAGKKLGASFLLNGAKFAISTISGGMVSGTVVEKASDTISESISSPVEKYIEEKIKASESEFATIEQFGNLLTEIYKESGKKIFFIIDELDRARPDFSLDLLEKIKHIFSVEGIIFLLVVNREQFEKSIESRYGNINSRLYLNKFVHYWFSLPKTSCLSDGCLNGYTYSTIKRYLLSIDNGNDLLSRNGPLLNTLSLLLEINGASLREAERCYSVFSVIEDVNKVNYYTSDAYKVALGLVVFLKVHNSQLLTEIVLKKIVLKEAIAKLLIYTVHHHNIIEAQFIEYILKYHYATNEELIEERKQRTYSDIEGGYGRRTPLLEGMFKTVEGFDISS